MYSIHKYHAKDTAVRQCPIKVRGNISPYTLYFGRPNTASYSALLGKAYKVGETEYGLQLAKHIFEQAKKKDPSLFFSKEALEQIMKYGDEVWSSLRKTRMQTHLNCLRFYSAVFEEEAPASSKASGNIAKVTIDTAISEPQSEEQAPGKKNKRMHYLMTHKQLAK